MKNFNSPKQIEAALFLDFIKNNGFNQYNYYQTLELLQSVPNSISAQMEQFNQFLLSEKVSYTQLLSYDLKGANGYLSEKEIIIPKSLVGDSYFQYTAPKVPSKIHSYRYPRIEEFESIIACHDWEIEDLNQLNVLIYYPDHAKYIGFISDKYDEKLKKKIDYYRHFIERINMLGNTDYGICHDSIKDKELFLIKKKRERTKSYRTY